MTEWLPLKGFQEDASEFLAARKDAFLLDEQGVGKTAATIRACDLIGAERILVLVAASARLNWIKEFTRFSPMDRGATAIMGIGGELHPTGITVSTYDMLVLDKDLGKQIAEVEWDVVVLDEAQQLKTKASKRTKLLYGRKCEGNGILAKAKRVWRLSGTLAPNNVAELWTHLHACGAYKGPWDAFVQQFCTGYNSDFGFKITGTKNAPELKRILAPMVMRRLKADVLPGLPPLTFDHVSLMPRKVDIPVLFPDWLQGRSVEEFKTMIEEMNARVAKTMKSTRGYVKRAAVIAALAASTSALRRYYGAAIVESYVEMVLKELREGAYDKLVIMAHHKCVIDALNAGLREFHPLLLWGGTLPERRQQMVDDFQNDPKRRVFIGNLLAAGTSITLHASCRLDMLEQSWVPGDNAQAIMRVHRLGQKRPTHVRFFSAKGGIHGDIVDACARKTADLAKVGLA